MKTAQPTPEQVQWLKANYRVHSNTKIGKRFDVKPDRVKYWLKCLGIKKRAEPRISEIKRKNFLTARQERYIDNFWRIKTHGQLADWLKVEDYAVSNYCAKKGYRKEPEREQTKEVIKAAVKKTAERVPAAYDNTSREDLLKKYFTAPSSSAPGKQKFIEVKCLDKYQMAHIIQNHLRKTAKEMADNLQIDELKVRLFCQANFIEPKPERISAGKKNKDNYHTGYMPVVYKLPFK